MCSGQGCGKKNTCRRFSEIPKKHGQSWFLPIKEDGTCDYHLSLEVYLKEQPKLLKKEVTE